MDNVSVVSYLPYKEYISPDGLCDSSRRCGYFYQCIIYGKPALILPHDYDQYDYAVRGLEAGIALTAKREDTEAIGRAFDELLARDGWSDLNKLSRVAQDYQPTEILKNEIYRLLGG